MTTPPTPAPLDPRDAELDKAIEGATARRYRSIGIDGDMLAIVVILAAQVSESRARIDTLESLLATSNPAPIAAPPQPDPYDAVGEMLASQPVRGACDGYVPVASPRREAPDCANCGASATQHPVNGNTSTRYWDPRPKTTPSSACDSYDPTPDDDSNEALCYCCGQPRAHHHTAPVAACGDALNPFSASSSVCELPATHVLAGDPAKWTHQAGSLRWGAGTTAPESVAEIVARMREAATHPSGSVIVVDKQVALAVCAEVERLTSEVEKTTPERDEWRARWRVDYDRAEAVTADRDSLRTRLESAEASARPKDKT